LVSQIRFPHKALYQNSTALASPSAVVRPLIDAHQTFDIAVTVWVRATEEEEEEHRKKIPKQVNTDINGLQKKKWKVPAPMKVGDGKLSWIKVSMEELIRDEDVLETPLYSDIAFRGLRLSDKGIGTAIKFRLPTTRLYAIP
jgi:hypothetical protein